MGNIAVTVPFRCNNVKELENMVRTEFANVRVSPIEENTYFLAHISALLADAYRIIIDGDCQAEIILMPTNFGFVNFKYEVDERDLNACVSTCEHYVCGIENLIQNGMAEDTIEKRILSALEKTGDVIGKKCYWMFNFYMDSSKLSDSHIFKLRHLDEHNMEVNGKYDDRNELDGIFEFSKGHKCYISTKFVGLELREDRFKELEEVVKYIFILLQHERMMLIDFKKRIIEHEKKENRKYKKLKTEILECLSKYTFETVSDSTVCQNIYMQYRRLWNLSEMEATMQDLIFTLNDEIAKRNERKIMVFTVVMTAAGVVSFIADGWAVWEKIFT